MFDQWFTEQVLFNGAVQGVVYGLLAMSIVLIFRSTKVINFAVGNMGLVGAGLLVVCNVNYGVPFWLSVFFAVLVGTIWGALMEMIVIRRLFRAPRVIVLVATIGIAQLSLTVLNAYPDLIGEGKPFPQAIGSVWTVGDVRISGSQALILITAPLIAVLIGWFLNRTLLGRTVRAAANNPDLARLKGISPKIVSTSVWAIGGAVGTISMILVGGLQGSAASLESIGPNTLLRAIVAAVIGRLNSFSTALAAGLVIGVGEAIIRFRFVFNPGLVDLILLIVVLVVVALQARRGAEDDSVFAFSPKVDAMPERLRSIFWVRHLDRITLLVLLAAAAALPLIVTQPSRHLLYASIAAFAICAMSLTVLTGWAGQLSLGQMAFAGIGALSAAAFTRGMSADWKFAGVQILDFTLPAIPFGVSLLLAACVSSLLAVGIGFGALRVRGLLLAVSTFAFALAASSWFFRLNILTGGASSSVPFPRGKILGLDIDDQRTYYYVVLAVLAVTMAMLGRIRRSGVGRVTLAVRDNARSAASYTVRPTTAKLRAFALSGWIAGLGGALLAGASQQFQFAGTEFGVNSSLSLVAMVVIGGMGSIAGAVIGALWVIGLPTLTPGNEIVPLLTSSLGLLVLLLYFPGGFVQVAYKARGALYQRLERNLPPVTKTVSAQPARIGRSEKAPVELGVVLRANDVTVRFGGLRANDGVSIEVRNHEIVGLIGTNGAGKTTLMNAIGGFVPCAGSIELLGEEVRADQAALRARAGLGRTFQAASLFPELTVRETVQVALEARGRAGLMETVVFSPRAARLERAKRAESAELLDFLGLGRYADRVISELSTGTRRIVELANLLALDANVLCLDEPTAGIAQRETEAMGPLLVDICRQLGASMLIIEHDMPFIMGMSDRVYCLELGRVIAEGPPNEVRNDPAVIASYLGTDQRTIERSGPAKA
jgi:ABC-type branched-subunit amino acid transport system ATPase component/ABC-type branched-subunit amino acid transport system permease subunit